MRGGIGQEGYSLAMNQEASRGPANAASRGAGRPPKKQPARPSLGGGTPAQGAVVYAEKCAACHCDKGEGKTNARLVGGQITGGGPVVKTVGSYWPYATTLFDYVRRSMPFTAPGSLTTDEIYAVCAYILAEGKVIERSTILDAETLPRVVMPNRDGFIPDPRPEIFK